MIWVVADTNVLASGLAAYDVDESPLALILDAWRYGPLELVASAPIVAELRRTLAKPYFAQRFTTEEIERALYLVRHRSSFMDALADVRGVATTPEDDLILATAVSGEALFLVTGDRQLRDLGEYQGIRIAGPHEFMDWLAANEGV